MEKAISETQRRRAKQQAHNEKMGITPQGLNKKVAELLDIGQNNKPKHGKKSAKVEENPTTYIPKTRKALEKDLKKLDAEMREFAQNLEFEKAAATRDKIKQLKEFLLMVD